MRTEKQLQQLAEARKHIKQRARSEETKQKISKALSHGFRSVCDYCGTEYNTKKSAFDLRKHHFCSRKCYSLYRAEIMPPEEQNAFGSGNPPEERARRIKARTKLNHYLRDNHIQRQPCEVCGKKTAEAHHDDYSNPLVVRWLCFEHHREWHKFHDNPELMEDE